MQYILSPPPPFLCYFCQCVVQPEVNEQQKAWNDVFATTIAQPTFALMQHMYHENADARMRVRELRACLSSLVDQKEEARRRMELLEAMQLPDFGDGGDESDD